MSLEILRKLFIFLHYRNQNCCSEQNFCILILVTLSLMIWTHTYIQWYLTGHLFMSCFVITRPPVNYTLWTKILLWRSFIPISVLLIIKRGTKKNFPWRFSTWTEGKQYKTLNQKDNLVHQILTWKLSWTFFWRKVSVVQTTGQGEEIQFLGTPCLLLEYLKLQFKWTESRNQNVT